MTLSARLARAAQARAQDDYAERVREFGLDALLAPYRVVVRVPEQRRRLAS